MTLLSPVHSARYGPGAGQSAIRSVAARYIGPADWLSLAPEPDKQMDISMHVRLEVFNDAKKRVPNLFDIDAECLRNGRDRLFLAEKEVDGLGYIGRLFAQYRFKLAGMARKLPFALPTGMRTTRTKKKFAKRGQDFCVGMAGSTLKMRKTTDHLSSSSRSTSRDAENMTFALKHNAEHGAINGCVERKFPNMN